MPQKIEKVEYPEPLSGAPVYDTIMWHYTCLTHALQKEHQHKQWSDMPSPDARLHAAIQLWHIDLTAPAHDRAGAY